MRGIVTEFGAGQGIIRPRDGGPDVMFGFRAIQTKPKTLMAGDEVEYELATDGTCSVVFRAH